MNKPFKQQPRKNMSRSLIDLMHRSDALHKDAFIKPEQDFVSWDHLSQIVLHNGNIREISLRNDLNYECRSEFVIHNKELDAYNECILHYITTENPSIKLAILDLDAMVKCYVKDIPEYSIKRAISYIRPIKNARYESLLKSGEISLTEHNVKFETANNNFVLKY